jgi:hypothetical protein
MPRRFAGGADKQWIARRANQFVFSDSGFSILSSPRGKNNLLSFFRNM